MRRSLGVRDAEPPQRMRSSEFGTAGAGGMNSNNRPGRTKSLLPQSSGMSSGKRQSSVSRLPVPGGSKIKQGNRSSSSGGQSVLGERGRSTVTPLNKGSVRVSSGNRSSERLKLNPKNDYITPQRVATVRKSMTSEKRLTTGSMGGGHQRLSGRGSQIGSKGGKDIRPLGDKTFQQSQVRKILDFLRSNGYPNDSLTSKQFPLSSKEFVLIFNFLYFFIDPRQDSVLPLNKFDEEVLKLLKMLHYPGNLSRSNFITMGSLHSWPTVLGSLAFMCDMATIYSTKLLPNIIALGFPSRDDMGFATDRESREKIQYEHHLNCYEEFNTGADEYPEQLQALRENLMENNNVDLEHLEYLKQQKCGLQQELERLDGRVSQRVELLEMKQTLHSDLDKTSEYLKKLQASNHEKEEEKKEKLYELENLAGRVESQQAKVAELMSSCEQGKVSHFEVERSSVLIGERRRQVESARREVEEMEKEVWQKEIQASRGRECLESLAKQVNSLALQENIKNQAGELISLQVSSFQGDRTDVEDTAISGVRTELNEMVRSSRTSTRNTEREMQGSVATAGLCKEEVATKKRDVVTKEGEVVRLDKELLKFKEHVEKEESMYNDQIVSCKQSLHQLKSQDRANMETLERELRGSEELLEKLRISRQLEKEKGEEFLRKVADKTVSYMEECTGYRDRAAKAVFDALKLKVEMVKKTAIGVEEKVKKALKETDTV